MFWIALIIAALFLAGATTKQNRRLRPVSPVRKKDRLKDLRREIPDGGNGRWR